MLGLGLIGAGRSGVDSNLVDATTDVLIINFVLGKPLRLVFEQGLQGCVDGQNSDTDTKFNPSFFFFIVL